MNRNAVLTALVTSALIHASAARAQEHRGSEPQAVLSAPASSVTVPSPSEVAAAATPPNLHSFEMQRIARLDSAIRELAQLDTTTKFWGGVGALILGGVGIAAGVLIAVDDSSTWGDGTGRVALSGAALTGGLGTVIAAIFRMAEQTPAEKRLSQWQEHLHNHQLNALEIGRFEGGLQAEAEMARSLRFVNAAGSIGLFATGGTLAAFSAFKVFEGHDARSAGYVIGGIAAGLGALNSAFTLLLDSPAEIVWKKYVRSQNTQFTHLELRPDYARTSSSVLHLE